MKVGTLLAPCAAFAAFMISASAQSANPPGAGAAGYCLDFDGAVDSVNVARSLALEPAEITVELWARIDGPQDWNTRLLRKGLIDAYFLSADQDLDKRMQFMVTRGTQILVQAKDPQAHSAYGGTWHHFLGIYTVDHLEFWVDGVKQSSVPHDLGALTHLPLTDLCIGAGLPVNLPNEYFNGLIDEVRIWNYQRSPAQIQASWNRTVAGGEPGLVGYWNFDEGSGQVAKDSSTFGHDGRLGWTALEEPSDPTWVLSDAPFDSGTCTYDKYCVAGMNSTGKPAHIAALGSTSIASNDFKLVVEGCPPRVPGTFFMGNVQTQIPFGEGFLCAIGNQMRIPPVIFADSNGAASLALDFTDPSSPAHLIVPGVVRNFQFWYRDPQIVGHGFNLTEGLHAHFCP